MRILCLFILICGIIPVFGQNVGINTTGAAAHPSAMLDISSGDKGVLIPRMSTSQRLAISDPAVGLMVFDTDTRSFWYYTTDWVEIINSAGQMTAGGDLTGQYPNPTVAKLNGHPISPLTPPDRYVLKWNHDDNMWQGMKDSLALPYSAVASHGSSLFAVTNTFNGFANSSAILGRRLNGSVYGLPFPSAIWGDATVGTGLYGSSNTHEGVVGKSQQYHGVRGESEGGNGKAGVYGAQGTSGITPGTTMGVWGNSSGGLGVVGTSNSGVGVYGFANDNHGVYGYSTNIGWAGIKGSHANDGGIGVHGQVPHGTGVLGEIQYSGDAIHGLSIGETGSAGRFQTSSATHSDTTLVVNTKGLGVLSHYHVTNTSNPEPAVRIQHDGGGDGLLAVLTKEFTSAKAINAISNGTGTALYGRSVSGVAGKFEILNSTNGSNAVEINNTGSGAGLRVLSSQGHGAILATTSIGATGRVLDVTNEGIGITAYLKNRKESSDSTVLRIDQAGLGNALSVIVGNQFSETSAIQVVSAADWGIASSVFGKHAIHGSALATLGIGVEGQALGVAGIGVKGVAKTSSTSLAIGVVGEADPNNANGIGIKAAGRKGLLVEGQELGLAVRVGSMSKQGSAGFFENIFEENYFPTVDIHSNGKGNALKIVNSNPDHAAFSMTVENHGNGGFLDLRQGGSGTKMSVGIDGTIRTDGAVYVRDYKGIVRNSTLQQLRVETVQAVFNADEPYEVLVPGEYREVEVTFSQPFSSAPAVYIANIIQDGHARVMLASVKNVTPTGCTLYFINAMHYDVALYDCSWNLVAMGPE